MASEVKPIGQFEFELTDELATRAGLALLQFQRFRVKKPHPLKGFPYFLLLLGVGGSLLLHALSYVRKQAHISLRDWIGGEWILLTTLALVVFVLLLLLFLTALTRFVQWLVPWLILRRARKLAHRRIEYALYEDRFERQAADDARIVPWSKLRDVHITPGFWFLVLKSWRTLCIPEQVLSTEVQSLISRKASEAGAAVEYWGVPLTQGVSK